VRGTRRRYVRHREAAVKGICLLYCAFNGLVAFPRVLASLPPGAGLSLALLLRYSNAQPLLTCNVVTMVRARPLLPSRRCSPRHAGTPSCHATAYSALKSRLPLCAASHALLCALPASAVQPDHGVRVLLCVQTLRRTAAPEQRDARRCASGCSWRCSWRAWRRRSHCRRPCAARLSRAAPRRCAAWPACTARRRSWALRCRRSWCTSPSAASGATM